MKRKISSLTGVAAACISIGMLTLTMSFKSFAKDNDPVMNGPAGTDSTQRIFVFYSSAETRDEFREFAVQLARLKQFGRVDVCINCPALKAEFEVPPNSCDWHEYASYNRSVQVFFPDTRLAPFIPEEYVKQNRQMLLYRAGVLKELGLYAAFRSNEPRYLPEAFFERYPDLRGPRVDHPRRSVRMEFAPCFHQPETKEMYRNMASQLFKNVPDLRTLYFSMNDAGSGFCWNDWLYSGPNGPSACKDVDKSQAIITLLNLYSDAARQSTGHDVDIYFKGMFTDVEKSDLAAKLPANCFLEGRSNTRVRNISTMMDDIYPVRGLLNPLDILRTLCRKGENPDRYIFDFWASYSRSHERIETVTKLVDIVVETIKNPPGEGEVNILNALKKLCDQWAGPGNSDRLFSSFLELDRIVREAEPALRGLSTLYWGVSERQITRPLVINPSLLKPEEEKTFLPFVFNVSMEEARNDYMDIHGGDRQIPENAVERLVNGLKRVSVSIEQIRNAPEQKFLNNMARALRLYACVVRTCGNFNDAQIIRNRNRTILAGPMNYPDKTPTWTGDPDLLAFNGIMRDELDNTQEMISLLESGGLDLVSLAKPPFPEDTFILGPDLINQLKAKRKVMLDHWTDIEGYLTTPFK